MRGAIRSQWNTTAVDYYYEVTREGQAETETSSVGPAYTEEGPGEMGTSGFMEREQRAIICGVVEGCELSVALILCVLRLAVLG